MRNSSQKNVVRLRGAQGSNRRFLMWRRKVKYGVSNFLRNGWLSLAAIVVMTMTLLTVFVAAAATVTLQDTVQVTKIQKMDLSLYLRSDTAETVQQDLKNDLEADENVSFVEISDKASSSEKLAQKVDLDDETKALLEEDGQSLDDILPLTVSIHVYDISQIDSLTELVNGESSEYQPFLDAASYENQFFHGENQKTVQNMTEMANMVQLIGFILAGVFLFITILVIFNTIRLAIFARKEEIEMEKLIGAEKSYVRGPFLVEAELYGIISGVLALVLGYGAIILFLPEVLTGASAGGIETTLLNTILFGWLPAVTFGEILLGIMIGNLSARLAVKKYLHY